MLTTKELNLMLDNQVRVDDGELQIQGVLKSIYKDKILIEIDADDAPTSFSIVATIAAVMGFDLEQFPDDKRYVPYTVDDLLSIEVIL